MVETSIIIPTYHRKQSLIRLLHSLKNQLTNLQEIVVVEQGENNGKIYRQIAKTNNVNLSYYHMKEISTSEAKNKGVRLSKGIYLIFYDDDVILRKNAVRNIVKNFTEPSVGGVSGRVITTGQHEEKDRKDVGRISRIGSFSDGFSSTIRQDVDTVIGCHAAWRRQIFNQVGGFDEQFTGNAMREESDLSLRVKKSGYRIVFDPSAVVIHLREPHGGARKADNRLYWYFHFFSNETYFFLKHRAAVLLPFFLLKRISYILRCMFGFGREVSLRSVRTPYIGVMNGIQKYLAYKKINI